MKNDFAEQLTLLRKRSGFNQDELAEASGVSIDTVRRWEGGKQEPRLGELKRIAAVLGVPVIQLIGDESERENLEKVEDFMIFPKKRDKKTLTSGKNTIIIQQGNVRVEIPATSRGYDILERKLKEVNVSGGEVTPVMA